MDAVVAQFVKNLSPKVKNKLQGKAKLVIKDQGCVMLDSTGARAGDDEANVTLIASEALFRAILDGIHVRQTKSVWQLNTRIESQQYSD